MFVPQAGYDRAITVFSPDGRLFQVEYALETVKRGTISIGMITSDGVLLAAEEQIDKFQDENFSRKLFVLDDNIGAALSGYVPDGRVLIDYSREICQNHRLVYDECATVEYVARRISDIKQAFTQQAGVRPFGVSIIFGGVDLDKIPKIFVTDPSGSYVKYFLAAIGNKSDAALSFLAKYYTNKITLEEAKMLAAAAIKRTSISEKQIKIRFLE
ncbi:proteasome subunit alpha, partial [Candidatus Geothermarchaeota archaeon]